MDRYLPSRQLVYTQSHRQSIQVQVVRHQKQIQHNVIIDWEFRYWHLGICVLVLEIQILDDLLEQLAGDCWQLDLICLTFFEALLFDHLLESVALVRDPPVQEELVAVRADQSQKRKCLHGIQTTPSA